MYGNLNGKVKRRLLFYYCMSGGMTFKDGWASSSYWTKYVNNRDHARGVVVSFILCPIRGFIVKDKFMHPLLLVLKFPYHSHTRSDRVQYGLWTIFN